jgi:hypothetical protein
MRPAPLRSPLYNDPSLQQINSVWSLWFNDLVNSVNTTQTTTVTTDTVSPALDMMINRRLLPSTSYILTGVVSPSDSGAIKCGDLTWNTSGTITGGSGTAMTPYGLLGAKNGASTFTIDINGNATFSGSVAAGSLITGSVQVVGGRTLTAIDAAATGFTPTSLQSALTAGVGNVLAGVGTGTYYLDVRADSGYIGMQHKDANIAGVAPYPTGTLRSGLIITSTGLAAGYNDRTTGAWVNGFAINSTGDASFAGTITANSIITGSVTIGVGGTALSTVETNAVNGATVYTGLNSGGSYTLGGVLSPSSSGAVKAGTIAWNSSTGAITGGSGIALTQFGLIGTSDGTNKSFEITNTGNAYFRGSVEAGGTVNITGTNPFTVGIDNYPIGINVQPDPAIHTNSVGGRSIVSGDGAIGWWGIHDGTGSTKGCGIAGQTTADDTANTNPFIAGVYARSTGTAPGLRVDGRTYMSGALQLTGGVNTSDSFTSTIATGTAPFKPTSTTKCDNLNADYLDGYHAGNSSGNIPVSNSTVNTNLWASYSSTAGLSYYMTDINGGGHSLGLVQDGIIDGGGSALTTNTVPNIAGTGTVMKWLKFYVDATTYIWIPCVLA